MKTKSQKRTEALVRQLAYDKLTPQQKLTALDAYGLRALRHRAKLKKLIEKAVA